VYDKARRNGADQMPGADDKVGTFVLTDQRT
jgi:hypothetical protein